MLDPFAGGGAIPLEAMRLGCEVTAIDINPVAWFILKCTLEYPQKLAGQHRQLPKFALESPEFMEGFFKGTGKLTKQQLERNLQAVQTKSVSTARCGPGMACPGMGLVGAPARQSRLERLYQWWMASRRSHTCGRVR